MSRILIIIPAYNEAESIEAVISVVKKELPAADILVVNDGSKDATSILAKEIGGVVVVDLPYNMGIGAAMQTGYRYADLKNYEIAVQVDADGQHPPDQIKYLTTPIIEKEADIVIGSRFLGKGEDYPEVEALVLLRKARFNIMEIPIRMKARTAGQSSITPLHAIYYMIKVLLAVFIDILKKVER